MYVEVPLIWGPNKKELQSKGKAARETRGSRGKNKES